MSGEPPPSPAKGRRAVPGVTPAFLSRVTPPPTRPPRGPSSANAAHARGYQSHSARTEQIKREANLDSAIIDKKASRVHPVARPATTGTQAAAAMQARLRVGSASSRFQPKSPAPPKQENGADVATPTAPQPNTDLTGAQSTRDFAVESLPMALPPIRLRRGEHTDEYKPTHQELQQRQSEFLESQSDAGDGNDISMSAALLALPWESAPSDTQLMWEETQLAKDRIQMSQAVGEAMLPAMQEAVVNVATKMEGELLRTMGNRCKQGVTATRRGIAVPYQWFERVTTMTLQCVEDVFDKTVRDLPHVRESMLVPPPEFDTPETEKLAGKGLTEEATSSAVAMRTAISAATLWRMLEQVQGSVPGMGASLPLLGNLLDAVYVGFRDTAEILPDVASLGEQIRQLVELPMAALDRTAALLDAQRAIADTRYLRQALQNWSFGIWKQQKLATNRRERFLDRLDVVVQHRLEHHSKRVAWVAWKAYVKEKSITQRVQKFEEEIGSIISPELTRAARNRKLFQIERRAKLRFKETETTKQQQQQSQEALDASTSSQQSTSLAATFRNEGVSSDKSIAALVEFTETLRIGPTSGGLPREEDVRASENNDDFVTPEDLTETFDHVVEKTRDLDAILNHLKAQVKIQRERIQKLEHENAGLKERLTTGENGALGLLHDKLDLKNKIQSLEYAVLDRDKRICRFKSRVRSQRHKYWRRAAMRIVADAAGVDIWEFPKAKAERSGDKDAQIASSPAGPKREAEPDEEDIDAELDDADDAEDDTVMAEEIAFADEAPLVFRSTTELPEALDILRDWANNCLDDLAALDGVRLFDTAQRVQTFGAELKDGVLYSRLLFFLALPRYRPRVQGMGKLHDVSDDCADNRRRVLRHESVQLHPPFPTHANCFQDLQRLAYHHRMGVLLEFATQLMSQIGEEQACEPQRGLSFPPGGPQLNQMVSPVALAEGLRGAHVSFLALLYVRFAHPFNHKCNAHISEEKSRLVAIVKARNATSLLSGTVSLLDGKSTSGSFAASQSMGDASASASMGQFSMAAVDAAVAASDAALEKVASASSARSMDEDEDLEDDEQSPWQLFVERAKPMVCSASHAYLLDGNFWPSDVIESAELLRVFGRIVMSLHKSLQHHRWHVTINCLVPTSVPRGMSRAGLSGMAIQMPTPGDFIMRYVQQLEQRQQLMERKLSESQGSKPLGGSWSAAGSDVFGEFVGTSGVDLREVIESLLVARQEVTAIFAIGDMDSSGSPTRSTAASSPKKRTKNAAREEIQRQATEQRRAVVELVRSAVVGSMNDIVHTFLAYSNGNEDPDTLRVTSAGFRDLCKEAGLTPDFLPSERVATVFGACDHGFRSRLSSVADPSRRESDVGSVLGASATEFARELTFEEFVEAILRLADALSTAGTIALAEAEKKAHEAREAAALAAAQAAKANAAQQRMMLPTSNMGSPGLLLPTNLGFGGTRQGGSPRTAQPSPPMGTAPPPTVEVPEVIPEEVNPFGPALAEAVRVLCGRFLADAYGRAPSFVMEAVVRGADVQRVLRSRSNDLQTVFHSYARAHGTIEGIDANSWSRLMKDAALVTHEFNYGVIGEIFGNCGFTVELPLMQGHTTIQQAFGTHPANPRTQAKSIVDFDRFTDAVALTSLYKLPNPFIPFATRLDTFILTAMKALAPKLEMMEIHKRNKEHLQNVLANPHTTKRTPPTTSTSPTPRAGRGPPK